MSFWIADGHCDYLYGAFQSGFDMTRKARTQVVSLPEMQEGRVAIQLFPCWIDVTLKTPPLHQCIAMIDAYHKMLAEHPTFTPLTKDFTPESGKIATVLTVEGGEAIDGSLSVLHVLYSLGVRTMTLTWNDSNELAGAALARGNKGLTALGKEVVDEMGRIGMALDVSHLSDKGIDDALSRASCPIFASHSNARAVYDSPRSLTDEYIREISRRGGTVGVNFYYLQLSPRPNCCINDIVRHILHVVEVGGIDCCALGSDIDGMHKYPVDFTSCRDFPKLCNALLAAGLSEEDVTKIAYTNLHRYITQFV